MPISTNAAFDELGHSMILRDIEQLYMRLAEEKAAREAAVSDIPDVTPFAGLTYFGAWDAAAGVYGTLFTGAPVLFGNGGSVGPGVDDPDGLYDKTTGIFTAPRDGTMLFNYGAGLYTSGVVVAGLYLNPFYLIKNGVTEKEGGIVFTVPAPSANNPYAPQASFSAIVSVLAGDLLYVKLSTGTASVAFLDSTMFSGIYLTPP